MCQLCEKKSVYEFTNKRKLCKTCFIRWFQKKVLYTIRKFELIKRGEGIIYYENKGDFRGVVLEEVLKIYQEKSGVEIKKLNRKNIRKKIAVTDTIDMTARKICFEMIEEDIKKLKGVSPVDKNIIKPLYLFLDKEVLLYAKLKNLKFKKFKKFKEKENKISNFIDDLEKKHPEIKRAIVNNWLGLR